MSRPIVKLITAIAAAKKAIQLYPPAHPTFQRAVANMMTAANEALSEGSFALNLHEGRLYVDSDVITGDAPSVASLAEAMGTRRVESVVFERGLGEQDALGLVEVMNMRPTPDLDVQAQLEGRGVTRVRVSALTDEDADERAERDRKREADRATYHKLIGTMRNLSTKLADGEQMDLAMASPMVEDILERLLEDEAAVLGMATINAGSEADLLHAINVMIYSLNLGVAIGIPEEGLIALGLAALVHDIGKAAFDRNDPEQRRAAEALHPTVGAELLSRISDDEGTTAMLVAYEHHMRLDGTGFPERDDDYVAHPYSRLVAIANRYDRLSKADYQGVAQSPDRAVRCLLEEGGPALDPFFTRLFIRTLGVFPIGCVVRLSDHSVGVVCARGVDPLEPKVRIVFGPGGIESDTPIDVDLAQDDRDVVEVVDPESVGIVVADFL